MTDLLRVTHDPLTAQVSGRQRSWNPAIAPVALVVLLVAGVEWVLLTSSDSVSDLTAVGASVMSYSAVLLSGVLVAHRWAVSRHEGDAWMVLALMYVGAQGLGSAVLWGLAPDSSLVRVGLLNAVNVAMTAFAAVVAALAARRRAFAGTPLALGGVVAVGVVAVQALATYAGPSVLDAPRTLSVVAGLGVQVHIVLACVILDAGSAPVWVRARLAGAVALHGLVIASSALTDGMLATQVALLSSVGVAALLVTAGLRLVRITMSDQRVSQATLEGLLDDASAAVRRDREKLHEIGASLAGIASASEMIRSDAPAAQQRREALEQMMHAEVARLHRLLHTPEPIGAVLLDDAVRHIVASHRTRGTDVTYVTSDLEVTGRSDAVAEIVNILLENAAQHGGPHVEVAIVHDGPEWVEIHVSDDGPGVPSALQERIFEREVSREGSPGQGLGLAIASGLATDQGGSLRLHTTSPLGTTFALRLLRRHTGTGTHPRSS